MADLSIGGPSEPMVFPDPDLVLRRDGAPRQREPDVDHTQLPTAMLDVYNYLLKHNGSGDLRPWGEDWAVCIEEFIRIERADKFPVCLRSLVVGTN